MEVKSSTPTIYIIAGLSFHFDIFVEQSEGQPAERQELHDVPETQVTQC